MLTCQICGYTHPSMISPSHLKNHGITGAEYRKMFPGNPLRVQSEETRQKMSSAKKGVASPFKGVQRGPNQALSEKTKGVPKSHLCGLKRTDEQKQRIREATKSAMQGVMTAEVRQKLSNAVTARKLSGAYVTPMQGKTHSADTKHRISEAGKKRYAIESQTIIDALVEKAQADNLTVLSVTDKYWFDLSCNSCGTNFSMTRQAFIPSKHDGKNLCPTCHPRLKGRSQAEEELFNFVQTLHPSAVANDRKVLGGKEIDIYIPELNLAFEYTGLYWHSEKQNPEKKHLLWKTQFAHNRGVRLITIFEDEWLNKQEIVKSRISGLLGHHTRSFMARKLKVGVVDAAAARSFLNANHIQGQDTSQLRLGLYDADRLVQLATFKKTNMVKGGDGSAWELSRFCSVLDTRVQGGASKLIKHFQENYGVGLDLISYADRRWSDGELYSSIGFEFVDQSPPSYWYMSDYKVRTHRSAHMKHKLLAKLGLTESEKTEWQLAQELGYDRIWDCGTTKWVLKSAPAVGIPNK